MITNNFNKELRGISDALRDLGTPTAPSDCVNVIGKSIAFSMGVSTSMNRQWMSFC